MMTNYKNLIRRSFAVAIAVSIAQVGFVGSVSAQQPWQELGLSTVTPISDAAGSQIRGTSASAASSGMSFISAMLFDPATGSNMQSVSSSKTGSSSMMVGGPANAQSQQLTQQAFALQVQSGLGNFSGSVFGIAGGFGLATSRP